MNKTKQKGVEIFIVWNRKQYHMLYQHLQNKHDDVILFVVVFFFLSQTICTRIYLSDSK